MHNFLMLVVMVVMTAATRFLPFVIFNGKRKTPPLVEHLGKVLPCAILGMLVVYCLKDVSLTSAPFGLPELIGIAVVALLHIWKRNSLLSIGVGTVCYMLLVQLVF